MPRSRPQSAKRVLGRIQRLCCLGIGGEMVIPDLIQEVMELVPSQHGMFAWVGSDFEITNTFSTFPVWRKELYFTQFYRTPYESALFQPLRNVSFASASSPVIRAGQRLNVDRRTFQRSEFYNALLRPVAAADGLLMCVRDSRRTHGVLYVHRAEAEVPFESDDLKMLASISGFIAHGMTRATLTDEAVSESDDRALFVADRDGVVRHANAQAQRLIMMALLPYWSPLAKWHNLHEATPQIRQLCRALAATADGKIGQPPPVLRLRNPWGGFVLRAYWFGPTDGNEQTRHIAITIEHQVPRALALRRRVENLPLTAREKQLCLLLVQDPSRQDLADAMGVAVSTIITHQHSVYAKLGVHNRAGLLAELQ